MVIKPSSLRRFSRLASVALLCALALGLPSRAQPAEDDNDEAASAVAAGEAAMDRGQYKSAKTEFKAALKEDPTSQPAARGIAEAYARTGEPDLAIKAIDKVIKDAGADKVDRLTLLMKAKLHFNRGEYDKTLETAQAMQKADAADVDGLLMQGKVERERGRYEDAEKTFEKVRAVAMAKAKTDWKVNKDIGRQAALAETWCSAGEAYFWLNRIEDANDCWAMALRADEFHLRTNDWMARLYLEQNHDVSALNNYALPTLKHNPAAAELHVREAQCHYFRWRSGQGKRSLDTAIKLNPTLADALAMRASRFIGTDQYDKGKTDYDAALKVNPAHMQALGAKGLHAITLGLTVLFDKTEAEVLAFNPRPSEFYEVIADGLSERSRFLEAIKYYEIGIKANPKHWTLYRGRGMAAVNMGDDKLGRESLDKALAEDPFRNNLQTVNLLTLFDSYKNYERIESPDGRFRLLVHRKEVKVMAPLYFEILNAAWDEQTKKYGFTPRTPLTVEAFPNHADFEVRSIGITGLPALGVCFGQLITLDSPSARDPGTYNWASTVRHEMDHVFQIQMSNGQVPRWLAEGLSSYEEKRTRPEWERHLEDQLFRYYHKKDIPSVRNFNEWFRDGSKVMFAYYLGNVMCEFIDKHKGGFAVISRMLEEFGKKRTPDQVFETCLNMKPEQFDKEFLEYVKKRISHLRMVPFVPDDEMDNLLARAEDGEATRQEYLRLALGYLQKGARFDCELWLGNAAKKGAADQQGQEGALYHYVKGLLAQNDEKLTETERRSVSREQLKLALGKGLEDFQVYTLMARFAQQERDVDGMTFFLNEALRAFPENAQVRAQLWNIYVRSGKRAEATKMAEEWMRVDESNLDTRLWLIETIYGPERDWTSMAEMAQQAIYTAPLDPRTHGARALALRKLKRYAEAVTSYELVRKLATGTPEQARDQEVSALLEIVATWLAAGETEKAKKALQDARALLPDHPRIRKFDEELNPVDEPDEQYSIFPNGERDWIGEALCG
ncbi:MAG: tetratricopeptide repeat protein [Planctomycetes bacterium]|nr:tetratricopeptide repeat protein [Planctomycetota bacterium]